MSPETIALIGMMLSMNGVSNKEIAEQMSRDEIKECVYKLSNMAFDLQQLSNLAETTSDRLIEISRTV